MINRRKFPTSSTPMLTIATVGLVRLTVSETGVTNTFANDGFGRLIAKTDGFGNVTGTEFEDFGHITKTIDGLGHAITYEYHALKRLVAVIDPLTNTTYAAYDTENIIIIRHLGATYPVDYAYDANGRLAKRTWARGVETFYAYDGWGNLTNTTYSDNTPTIALYYDALGRQAEAHDAAGVTTFTYDDYGALTNETVIGVAGTNVIERYYDTFGRNAGVQRDPQWWSSSGGAEVGNMV